MSQTVGQRTSYRPPEVVQISSNTSNKTQSIKNPSIANQSNYSNAIKPISKQNMTQNQIPGSNKNNATIRSVTTPNDPNSQTSILNKNQKPIQ